MTKTITHTFNYSHKPEAVWEYLTKPELIAQWLMPNDFKPVVGYEFRFTVKPMPQFNLDGIFYCKILELVPNKKLVYTWKGGPAPDKTILDTTVIWTLTPKDGGTELHLEHKGFGAEDAMQALFGAMDNGWLGNIKKIATLLAK